MSGLPALRIPGGQMLSALALAVVVPVLALCFLAAFDTVVFVTGWQHVKHAAASLAASIAATQALHEPDLRAYFAHTQAEADPYDVTRAGSLSAAAWLGASDGKPLLAWRRSTGTPTAAPDAHGPGVPVGQGAVVVTAELWAPVSPWLVGTGLLRGLLPLRLHASAAADATSAALAQVDP